MGYLELRTLAPNRAQACWHAGGAVVDPAAYRHYIGEIRRLRHEVYVQEGFVREDDIAHHADPLDEHAWHFVLRHSGRSAILGCARLIVVDLAVEGCDVDDVLAFGGVEFVEPVAESLHRDAVARELARLRREESRFVYVGGVATLPSARRLGAGARLCLATFPLARAARAEGLTFAAADRVADLDLRVGAYALADALPTFYCASHKADCRMLGLRPHVDDPRAARLAVRIEASLNAFPALLAG